MAKPTKKARRLAALKGWRNRRGVRHNPGKGRKYYDRVQRLWAGKGLKAGATGRTRSSYDSWGRQRGKPRLEHDIAVAQGAFHQGFVLGQEKRKNPCSKSLTLRNMALVTIKRNRDGSVAVSGRRMKR